MKRKADPWKKISLPSGMFTGGILLIAGSALQATIVLHGYQKLHKATIRFALY